MKAHRFPGRRALRLARTLTPVMAAVLLSACGTLTPEYQRPQAPVAANWSNPAPAGVATAAAPAIQWQDFFADARLRALIELSLKNNRDLRVAVLNIEQARAQFQIRRADQFPTINAAASATRQPVLSGGRVLVPNVYSVGLGVTAWELDFFDRLGSLKQAALAQYLGTDEARKATRLSLIASVASGYLSLQSDDELLALTRQTLATREDSLRLTRLKFDNGASSELDWRQAESLVEGARVTLAQLQRQRALDENALVLLLGQPMPEQLPPAASLSDQRMLGELPAGLPSEVLIARPDIRQAEQSLLAANANIGAARATFFPRISLTASAGTVSNQLSGLFKSGSWAASVAPLSLVLPIFDAGRNQANLESARAARDIAVAQYEKAIQSAFREVADALAGRATLTEQLRAQQAQAQAEAARFRLSGLRYTNGVASFLDQLDAQRSLFAAQQAVIQTRLLQLQNQVALYKALGGGTAVAEPGDTKLASP
jgi:multidrug efflux system outer membrane protein